MQKNNGFTILEVVIVIAIIAIVAAIAIPNMLGARGEARLNGVVNNLKGDLNGAKMMAVRENAFVVVNFFANRYEIFVDNGLDANAENWTRDADERRLLNRQLPAGVAIDLAFTDLPGDRMRYNRRGLPQNLPPSNLGRVAVATTDGTRRVIEINRLGRIDIQ